MWYDFFVKFNYQVVQGLKYVKSMNLPSPMDAARMCKELGGGLMFQETFITLREHDGFDFVDLPDWKVSWVGDSMPDSIFRDLPPVK